MGLGERSVKVDTQESILGVTKEEYDELECIVFPKSESTMIIRVEKGGTPNWFHRKMQELVFGIQWRKT